MLSAADVVVCPGGCQQLPAADAPVADAASAAAREDVRSLLQAVSLAARPDC